MRNSIAQPVHPECDPRRHDSCRRAHPSVRLFEAAACGTPIISDVWDGLDTLFVPGREIALANGARDVLDVIGGWSDAQRDRVAAAARQRVLAEHTASHRARAMEASLEEADRRVGAARILEAVNH